MVYLVKHDQRFLQTAKCAVYTCLPAHHMLSPLLAHVSLPFTCALPFQALKTEDQ